MPVAIDSAGGEGEHAAVDADVLQPRQADGLEAQRAVDAPHRKQQAERRRRTATSSTLSVSS